MTVTVVTLLKRRAGMSREAFRDYYEARHRLIGEQVLSGFATRYVRRYLTPADDVDRSDDYDVVMEIDFPDEAVCDACFAALADPVTQALIVADEERLFDRSLIRTFKVADSESTLPPVTSL